MVTIYRDYGDEPEDVFLPLPDDYAAFLYALEMDTFSEDLGFFQKHLPPCGPLLEMGCGSGRIACRLAKADRPVTGIDISLPMLRRAVIQANPHCAFACMDMLTPAFSAPFAAVLIPYNTLNLLTSEEKILRCLNGCREILQAGGRLLLQLFIPTADFLAADRTTFQFQTFSRPGGGRIIKEILKKYLPDSRTVRLEERFRIRPMQPGVANEDYHAVTHVAGYPLATWLSFFANTGFYPDHIYGDYGLGPYDAATSSCCLVALHRR